MSEMGRKAAVMRIGKLEFPDDCSAHHFHVGCAISENPQNSGILEFTRQEYDGHIMAAMGPFADCLLSVVHLEKRTSHRQEDRE